jgi:hypothetical protein
VEAAVPITGRQTAHPQDEHTAYSCGQTVAVKVVGLACIEGVMQLSRIPVLNPYS